jgi:pimeloyl-ACP methyl ester carboxylesterase
MQSLPAKNPAELGFVLTCMRQGVFGACITLTACGSVSDSREAPPTLSEIVATTEMALADTLPEQCQGPELLRVKRTFLLGNSKSTFSYGFRFKAPSKPGAPVLVYLPGGPGSTSTEAPPTFVPEGWGYLLTDPRGVGCNTLAQLPSPEQAGTFFNTQAIAADVIAAIQNRSLNNYILFGLSYGTLLGTTVAHEIERQRLTPPKAVVLEGVLGRAFVNEFVAASFIEEFDRLRTLLPVEVLHELDTQEAPFGIDAVSWSILLGRLMPAGPTVVTRFLTALASPSKEATLNSIRALTSQPPHTELGDVELYRQVACREIASTVPASNLDVILTHGHLVRNVVEEGTKCRELKLVDPFDSAKNQFKAKAYYFIGESDVATPAWQGIYHFKMHQGAAVKVVTKNGGHNSLRIDLGACAVQLMTSINTDGAGFDEALAGCPGAVEVEKK